jgi:hypothetical protein
MEIEWIFLICTVISGALDLSLVITRRAAKEGFKRLT